MLFFYRRLSTCILTACGSESFCLSKGALPLNCTVLQIRLFSIGPFLDSLELPPNFGGTGLFCALRNGRRPRNR